jgi:hypothetical protein
LFKVSTPQFSEFLTIAERRSAEIPKRDLTAIEQRIDTANKINLTRLMMKPG